MEKTVQFSGFASEIESKANKETVITANSDNSKYPSSKAVADYTKEATANCVKYDADSEWIFDGGGDNDDTLVDTEIVIDSVISDNSENAVMNKAIKEYVDNMAETVRQETLLAAHPIGSIYISMSVISPAELFGGIWERTAKGRAIVGVDEDDADFSVAEREVGEKGHVLSVEEMPSHDHKGIYWLGDTENGNISLNTSGGNPGYGLKEWVSGTVPEAYPTIYTGYNGGGKEHNNIQPSMTFYIWKRTA